MVSAGFSRDGHFGVRRRGGTPRSCGVRGHSLLHGQGMRNTQNHRNSSEQWMAVGGWRLAVGGWRLVAVGGLRLECHRNMRRGRIANASAAGNPTPQSLGPNSRWRTIKWHVGTHGPSGAKDVRRTPRAHRAATPSRALRHFPASFSGSCLGGAKCHGLARLIAPIAPIHSTAALRDLAVQWGLPPHGPARGRHLRGGVCRTGQPASARPSRRPRRRPVAPTSLTLWRHALLCPVQ